MRNEDKSVGLLGFVIYGFIAVLIIVFVVAVAMMYGPNTPTSSKSQKAEITVGSIIQDDKSFRLQQESFDRVMGHIKRD